MAKLLSSHGVRPTQQRLAVYDYLLKHATHPSAETMYEALVKHYPAFSKTTVYNSLHALVKAGLVLELSLGGEEKHYDGDISLHGHFSCIKCGDITDFPLNSSLVDKLKPRELDITGQCISFCGVCPCCGTAALKNK